MGFLLSFSTIILIIVLVLNVVLSFGVYANNPKKTTNRIFAILGLVTSVWLAVMFFSLRPFSANISLLLIRLSIFFATPMSMLFLMLSLTLPDSELKITKGWKIFLILITVLVMVIDISPQAFTGVKMTDNTPTPTPGPGLIFFGLYVIGTTLATFLTLIRRQKGANAEDKKKIFYVILGILLMYGFMLGTVFLPVAIWGVTTFAPLFPVYTLFFTGLTSYTILRHGLFNLRIIAAQAFTLIMSIILFSKLFVSQNQGTFAVDSFIFTASVIFGVLLVRSVRLEVRQREKLQDLTEKLKALDKTKDEFLSMAAHELRAPMTAIKGYVSMVLEGDTGDIPEKARGFLADTSNITDRLIRLVNNMLNVGRIEEGRMTYQEEVEYLSVPITSVFNQFTPEAERKGLKYTLEIPTELRDKVRVDPDRIQEVVGNFISNSIKYTNEGFVKVKMIQSDENSVRVEVIDSGSGISKEEQKNLFQKFHRVESNVGKTTGTGLGLYISKLLVEKFNGKIGIDSDLGKGSTFWFELPLVS